MEEAPEGEEGAAYAALAQKIEDISLGFVLLGGIYKPIPWFGNWGWLAQRLIEAHSILSEINALRIFPKLIAAAIYKTGEAAPCGVAGAEIWARSSDQDHKKIAAEWFKTHPVHAASAAAEAFRRLDFPENAAPAI